MRRTITEADLRRRMASMLRAVERGDQLTIMRDGEPIARLVPPVVEDSAKRVRVRPKKVVKAGEPEVSAAPEDIDALLERVKVRRQELVAEMESATSERPDMGGDIGEVAPH